MVDTRLELRQEIQTTLRPVEGDDFSQQAVRLLAVLGYRSERTVPDQSGAVAEFLERFPPKNPDTKSEREFQDAAESVHVLFQVTGDELAESSSESRLFKDGTFQNGNAKSFLFTAVELKSDGYARGHYATFTREINKRFPAIPSVVLFRTATGRITMAFVHLSPNKRNPERNVIGSVSLVREIDPDKPHRAHLEILGELSSVERFRWMTDHGKSPNFDGLFAAWLDALDTEALNRDFYRELFQWFEWAVNEARFPTTGSKVLKSEEHVIRLITRFLFIWFIKEKGLVADDLFVEDKIKFLLEDYDSDNGDSYYRAILQNLFFATLNAEIDLRRFSSRSNATHRDFSRYRYADELADPDGLKRLFDKTPFINGGLFDCLDSEESTRHGGYRIDCFTDNADHRRGYSVPNRLFFSEDQIEPGLITLFNRYKFTLEENTPVEQEVALDPELLGKVFEHLLAAYNPETRENARKQTGSYYTPRDVVDYMVDEVLVASLSQKAKPSDGDQQWWNDRLHYLFDYNDAEEAGEFFDESEIDQLVDAVANLRVVDPAVGSGAFPMGVLHKLTLALRRLDPDNRRWEALQINLAVKSAAKPFHTSDQKARDEELKEVSATFERYRHSDYGRKLYLIQNSVFGVDIQPVATQIAKLRFFISLAIEQERTRDPSDNYGIQPLPNLETRFVAADTLLGLKKPMQLTIGSTDEVTRLEDEIKSNRERHFHATTRRLKLECRERDWELRDLLATALEQAEFSADEAARVARWDPYDQNASAGWFDPEYMFGIQDGFDIVIGNPPYVQLQKDGGRLGILYSNVGFSTFVRTGDIYQLFYERGFSLLATDVCLSYITSNSWLKAEYGKPTRFYMSKNCTLLRLLEMGKSIFENVIVDTSVILARSGHTTQTGKAIDLDNLPTKNFPPEEALWSEFRPKDDKPWSVLSRTEQSVMDKMFAKGTPLKEWDISIYRGITTGLNEAFIIDNQTKEAIVTKDPRSARLLKPIVRGRDIRRYHVDWKGWWLIATFPSLGLDIHDFPAIENHLRSFGRTRLEQSGDRLGDGIRSRKKTSHAWFEMQDTCAYHANFRLPKLFWADMARFGRFAFSDEEIYCNNKGYILTGTSLKYLCAVLNSSLVTWWVGKTAVTTGMGLTEWTIVTVERIPIPKPSDTEQHAVGSLVDRILADSVTGQSSGRTSALQTEIDLLVYGLYGLSEEEMAVVEDVTP